MLVRRERIPVIRKIVFSLICLVFSGMSAFAMHIIMTDHALLTVPKSADLSAHVDFHEGKRLVRFAGGKMYGGDAVRFMCIKKSNTWKPDKVWWSMDDKLGSPYSYRAFSIFQYEDLDSERYFYGVACWDSMDTVYRNYLLGLDKDGKKMNEYINSDHFKEHTERHLESGIFDRNGNLYLTFHDWPGLQPDAPVYYQLTWSEDNQWFGYEYLGTQKP